ncbi:MAG: CotH kinase family protein, partial [Clostridiales bacterium]|nr:CotH kinase family protein [Clostridiales bacterium]
FSYDFYYEEVGVRMKGNTSRRHFYGDDGFYQNVHFKMSFGETFDDEEEYAPEERKVWPDKTVRKARKDRTFGGMEKLDVKYNKNEDESYVKEVYAMKLFRDNGIVAPRATLCAVSARNRDYEIKNLGVYTLYEAVDSVFLTRNFKNDDKGDLYKCGWSGDYGANLTRTVSNHGNALYGIEDELKGEFYVYDKKTNKKVVDAVGQRDFSSITNFIEAVNSQNANYAALIDTDYFARFEAVNYILGNPDCIRNNYNNYYIYFRPSDGKAIFIPYDYDRCFGITKDWAPNNACLELKPYDKRTSGYDQANPIYFNLIVDGAPSGEGSVCAKYRDYLSQLSKSEMLKSSEFDKVKNVYKAHYDEVTKTALGSNNTRFDANDTGNYSYSYYIEHKLEILKDNIDF